MYSHLQALRMAARADQLRRAATTRGRIPVAATEESPPPAAVTLRFGFPDDAEDILRLAELDSAEPPEMPVLVAEVGGELQVVLSLTDGTVVADPFRRTAEVIELLRARASQLTGGGSARRSRGRLSLTALSSWLAR